MSRRGDLGPSSLQRIDASRFCVVNRWTSVGLVALIALGACGPEASTPPVEPAPNGAAAAPMNEDQARVLSVINAERNARELPPIELVAEPQPLVTAAEMIRRGSPPDVALRTALGRLVEKESSEGRGWCVPTENLADLQMPSVLVEDDELTLGIVVVRMPATGGAVSEPFVVCYLVIEDGQDLQGK